VGAERSSPRFAIFPPGFTRRKQLVVADLQSLVVDSTTLRLRAFVALAEHRNFGRAAREVFVTQQALSKQIATLETEIGVPLVNRTTRVVELTAAGEVFLTACREALHTFDAGVEAVRGDPGIIRLGLVVLAALELTEPILAGFRDRRRASEIITRQFTFRDPSAGLADDASDIAIVRLPITLPGLRSLRLFEEPRVAALAADHPLARRKSVEVINLVRERMTVSTAEDEVYLRFWTLADYRSVPMLAPIPVRTHAEELEVVASGRAISVTSACAARLTPHPGVHFVPISDIPGTVCALAWRAADETELIRQFVETAQLVLEQERELVRTIEHPAI
jgi:DNA-binding transcriptional LysR family regulator